MGISQIPNVAKKHEKIHQFRPPQEIGEKLKFVILNASKDVEKWEFSFILLGL